MARPRRNPDPEDIDRCLQALGDPTRRRVVELLGARPHSVSALADVCGISVTAVGQHLRILEEAGLIETSKIGRSRSCQIDPAGLAIVQQWISDRRSTWERHLDRLGDLLDQDDMERS